MGLGGCEGRGGWERGYLGGAAADAVVACGPVVGGPGAVRGGRVSWRRWSGVGWGGVG